MIFLCIMLSFNSNLISTIVSQSQPSDSKFESQYFISMCIKKLCYITILQIGSKFVFFDKSTLNLLFLINTPFNL